MQSGSKSYQFSLTLAVLVEATAYKAYEICHLVGLEKNQCSSLRFLRKAPTKNYRLKKLPD